MIHSEYKDILLAQVQKPSQYLGSEVNSVQKDWDQVKTRVCLAFPDMYDVGMSHFGMQILYHVLNEDSQTLAERVFSPDTDMENLLREHQLPLFSLESGRPVADFDILGVSLLYELNYTNVLNILDLAGVPLYSGDRDSSHPLVVAGGPCTVNPEPMAAFFDAMVIGDGEEAFPQMIQAHEDWKNRENRERRELFLAWSKIRGVYVPSLFTPDGNNILVDEAGDPAHIRRAILPDLSTGLFPDRPIVAFGKPVHDRLRLEIARGCRRGCRFCQAGYIYRPLRERNVGDLSNLTRRSLASTGYEDLSMLSLSAGDHSRVAELLETMMDQCAPRRVAVSLPSVRADTLTPELMELIKKVRKTGFTIAPEAGSQRLRDVINKNLTEEDIRDTVLAAFSHGWRLVKLYFMIGLPTETDEDIGELIRLASDLKRLGKGRADVTASVGIFIPKSHTPFQWAGQIREKQAWDRLDRIKGALRKARVKVKWQNPRVSMLEGLMARGGRELSPLIQKAWERGCRFDGWTERFAFSKWQEAAEELSIDWDGIMEARDLDAPLPWDHVDMGVEKAFYKKEWQRALDRKTTPPCDPVVCPNCGVCDRETVNVVHAQPQTPRSEPENRDPGQDLFKYLVEFKKTGQARFLGHLEMMSAINRAVRRAGLPVAYSKGFHPLPKLSFSQALPVLMESEVEDLLIRLTHNTAPKKIMEGLNQTLPRGLEILSCRPWFKKSLPQKSGPVFYEISPGGLDREKIRGQVETFNKSAAWEAEVKDGKAGTRLVDLKKHVAQISFMGSQNLVLVVQKTKEKAVRPMELIRRILGLSQTDMAQLRVKKIHGPESGGKTIEV